MTGTMKAYQPQIKYEDVTIGNVTLNANGFLDIESHIPCSPTKLMFALMRTWGNSNPAAAFAVTQNGKYLLGSANQSITSLVIRYFYTD